MGRYRVWSYRGLVFVAVALMIVSFLLPWWSMGFDIVLGRPDPARIYAYGMRVWIDMPQEIEMYLKGDETPAYQTYVAFGYLTIAAGLAIASVKLFGKAGRWLLGGIGATYIAWGIGAIQMILHRITDYDIQLQGSSITSEFAGEYPVVAFTTIRFGFYLAMFAGGLMLALGIFKPFIEGKQKSSSAVTPENKTDD